METKGENISLIVRINFYFSRKTYNFRPHFSLKIIVSISKILTSLSSYVKLIFLKKNSARDQGEQ